MAVWSLPEDYLSCTPVRSGGTAGPAEAVDVMWVGGTRGRRSCRMARDSCVGELTVWFDKGAEDQRFEVAQKCRPDFSR